jgi:hypothetical protein
MDVYGHVLPTTDESVTDAMEAMFSTRLRESRGLRLTRTCCGRRRVERDLRFWEWR